MNTHLSSPRLSVRLLLGAIAVLALAGCSDTDSPLPDPNGQNILQIGQLSVGNQTKAETEWSWQNGDEVKATAGSYSATYTYNNGTWTTSSTEFTKEHVGVTPITVEYGGTPPTNQSAKATYRKADYLKATATLSHVTINATLEHQYADLVVLIKKGDKWDSDAQFNNTMADASLEMHDVTPYRATSTEYRCILYPAALSDWVEPNNTLATLTFGSSSNTPTKLRGRTATIVVGKTYTEDELKGARLTVTVTLDLSLEININATISEWKSSTPSTPFPDY